MSEDEGGVAAVERALSILDAMSDPQLSLAELSNRTGMYKSTLLRLLVSLERFGYVLRTDAGTYRLGSKVLHLGSLYRRYFKTSDVVPGVLKQIAEELNEGASFYVRDADQRVCLHRVDATRAIRDSVTEGDRLPLTVGAAAHVIQAFGGARGVMYDEIRHRMYSHSSGERDAETAAIAVPVFGLNQDFMGALSVSGPRYRIDAAGPEGIVPVLFKHAKQLTKVLGGDVDASEFNGWNKTLAKARRVARVK
ncbi:IclR family transcriptional regulator [soil metagenome]